MAELSYIKLKTANEARMADEARLERQKRNIMVLIRDHLSASGYTAAAHALEGETHGSLSRFEVCDNMDLVGIVQEYEAYYEIKFGRAPRLTRTTAGGANGDASGGRGSGSGAAAAAARRTGRAPSLKNAAPLPPVRSGSGRVLSGATEGSGPTATANTSANSGNGNGSGNSNGNGNGTASPRPPQPATGRRRRASAREGASTTAAHGNVSSAPAGHAAGGGGGSGSPPQLSSRQTTPDLGLTGMGVSSGVGGPMASANGTAAAAGGGGAVSGNNGGRIPIRGARAVVDVRAELQGAVQAATRQALDEYKPREDKLLKPLAGFGYSDQNRELAAVITRDIYSEDPNVRWTDLIGLDKAVRLVKEAVVYPIRYPQLFRGILSPWKGILLYGPPGTGKTMLAKAIATECHTTFFNISASSIVSKWRGDSEKLVRVLFELARYHAPSTIFLDELDALMSTRDGSSGGASDHEASRRLKTELLMQMDGLSKSDDLVFVLGASNLPWELDTAMLRRLEKRILVDLPTLEAREAMLRFHLPPLVQSQEDGGFELRAEVDYAAAAARTEGYSGSDIRLVCKEAAMRPVRQIFDVLDALDTDAAGTGSEPHIKLPPVTTEDVEAAIATTKPSAANSRSKFLAWQREYESV